MKKNVNVATFSEMCNSFSEVAEEALLEKLSRLLDERNIYERWSQGEPLEEALPTMKPLPMSEITWSPPLNSKEFMKAERIHASFNVESENGRKFPYRVNLSNYPPQKFLGDWGLSFDRAGSYSRTGDMGAESGVVFATVVMVVNKFAEIRLPQSVSFSSEGASRTSLYKALSKRFAGKDFDVDAQYGGVQRISKGTGEYARTVEMPTRGGFRLIAKNAPSDKKPLISLGDLDKKEPVALFRKINGTAVAIHINDPAYAESGEAALKDVKHNMHVYQMSIRDAKAAVLKQLLPIAYPELTADALKAELSRLLRGKDQKEWNEIYRKAQQADAISYNKVITKAMSKPQFKMDFVKLATASWSIGYLMENPGAKPPELMVMDIAGLNRYIMRSKSGSV